MRSKKMKASNCSHLMPLYGYWQGNKNPSCLLINADGVPFALDPFDPNLSNYNGIILGSSGGGKSFFVLHLALMLQSLKDAPKIIWIDNGASSKQVVEALKGQYVELDLDKTDISLNMFDLPEGEDSPSPSKIKLILAVLESILTDEQNKRLPKRDKALLEESIYKVYEKQTPLLIDLRNHLKTHDIPQMRIYAQILYTWTESVYGKLLNRKTNINLESDLISIEIKGLDSYPDLQNVLLLLLTDFIKKEASRDLKRPYLLLIDEGWKLFETPTGRSFAIEAYRTFRKFLAGIWIITQNYRDVLGKEDIANAILLNTAQVCILPQKKIDWEDFSKRMGFSNFETDQIKELQVKKGHYSEVFYIQENKKTILRIVPDYIDYWLCTSDPKDKAVIEQLKEQYPDLNLIDLIHKIS